jgi:HSP20 family protein
MDDQIPAFFTSFDELKENLENGHEEGQSLLNLANKSLKSHDREDWFTEDYEGQLAVDVYQSGNDLIVKSTIAGIQPEDLEIYINNDLLTIRGKRESEIEESKTDYFYKECYWGGFSRSIILPCEVQIDRVEATFKNGILKIVLPIALKARAINVKVTEE